jgi:hypothetical protein
MYFLQDTSKNLSWALRIPLRPVGRRCPKNMTHLFLAKLTENYGTSNSFSVRFKVLTTVTVTPSDLLDSYRYFG